MTAELDPLDAVIERVRRSEPPADGWPRARRRFARRRRRRSLFTLAAAAVVIAAVGLWPAHLGQPRRLARETAPMAPAQVVRNQETPPMAAPKTPDKDAGVSRAGVWPAPRLAVAAGAPVIVSTGGADPIKLGGTVPAGTVGERVHVWNWEKSDDSRVLAATVKGAFTVTPDGAKLVAADRRVIDLATGAAAAPDWWGARKLRPAWLEFSPDGKTLLAFEHDGKAGTARLIDFPAGTERTSIGALWWAASKVGFSADGKTVALFGSDAHLRTFDAATGKEKAKLEPAFANTIQAIAVSADGARVAGSYRAAVRVWDAATGKLVCEPDTKELGADPEFRALAFSPDGKRLAGGGSGPLALWGAADGALVQRFPRESSTVARVRFDAAGTTITTVKDFYIRGGRTERAEGVYPTVERWPVGK